MILELLNEKMTQLKSNLNLFRLLMYEQNYDILVST